MIGHSLKYKYKIYVTSILEMNTFLPNFKTARYQNANQITNGY